MWIKSESGSTLVNADQISHFATCYDDGHWYISGRASNNKLIYISKKIKNKNEADAILNKLFETMVWNPRYIDMNCLGSECSLEKSPNEY